ncbi:hypothetical protein IMCC3135_30030 [Granulosicoccus antarcticus IMCC3135]|uniref:Uncharacterized protein n=1 Tax=Granulosicoccus antarcticus IMCC3135 TaxID=1192854 RepID=A0A2Z2P019_9GAMM|nr:hypothetical protein IMCC3135_30030 [Granulosicoccus antarcticus IMCC3135]
MVVIIDGPASSPARNNYFIWYLAEIMNQSLSSSTLVKSASSVSLGIVW